MTHKAGRGALVALIAAASIALGAGASMSAPVTVEAGAFQQIWTPKTAPVVKGQKVVWKNPSFERHTIRSYGANWNLKKKTLQPGERFAKRFKKTGAFRYRCTLHSFKQDGKWTGMVGKIKVTK